MVAADFPPQIIYAYEKTGLIITEFNRHLCSKKDLKAWKAAIEEYFALLRKPPS